MNIKFEEAVDYLQEGEAITLACDQLAALVMELGEKRASVAHLFYKRLFKKII